MVGRDLLVFPLLDEGMPLVLMQAIQVGLPVIASDIEPVRELAFEGADLPLPGDCESWKRALIKVLKEGPPEIMFVPEKIPGVKEMSDKVSSFYSWIIERAIREDDAG